MDNLKPTIELTDTNSKIIEDISHGLDFSKKQQITIVNPDGSKKIYSINTIVFTGLPIISIETENRYINPDKNVYVKGYMQVSKTNEFPLGFNASLQLKGRGNATWSYPKKPYRIKLDHKSSLFNIAEDKNWVLLAGYCDKSLLRASLQFKTSELLQLEYTPKWQYVELFLNGQFQGNYLFTEHIKTSKDRVKVESDGYLFEKDGYAIREPVYFLSDRGYGFSFKTPDPDDGITDNQIEYARNRINELEKALDSDDVLSDDATFLKLIDAQSWAKWYLVNFILANQDTNDYYVITSKDEKLKKGPVWDAEWSIGIGWDNTAPVTYNQNVTKNYAYYEIMMKNPTFRKIVYDVFMNYKENLKEGLTNYINDMHKYLEISQKYNFNKWPIMNSVVSVNYTSNGSWDNEIQYVKDYISKRLDWVESTLR